MAAPTVRAEDIRNALRLRYPPGSHALLWEVANGTGSAARRFADAVAVGLWPSHGHEVEGIEVKVTRADWVRERANAEKSQPVFGFCHRWWLAVPKGLVEPGELPPTWGMLELCGDVMRVKVKAPALEPAPMSRGFVASLLRRSAGADEAMQRAAIERELHDRLRNGEAAYKENLDARHRTIVKRAQDGIALLDRIRAETGLDFAGDYDDNIKRAIPIAIELARAGSWGGKFQPARRAAAALVKALDELVPDAAGED